MSCIYYTAVKKGDLENRNRDEWLKHKGMDPFEAMQLYIEKVKELAQIYPEAIEEPEPEVEEKKE